MNASRHAEGSPLGSPPAHVRCGSLLSSQWSTMIPALLALLYALPAAATFAYDDYFRRRSHIDAFFLELVGTVAG